MTGDPAVCLDRYLIEARDSGALVALVEHTLRRRVLAAPMHRHSREDEYSFVLEGVLGVVQDDDEATAEAGAVIFKPLDHWHTFWNAGDETLRVLEAVTPAGLEGLFRRLAEPVADDDPQTLPVLAAEYGCAVDFDRTMPLSSSGTTCTSDVHGRRLPGPESADAGVTPRRPRPSSGVTGQTLLDRLVERSTACRVGRLDADTRELFASVASVAGAISARGRRRTVSSRRPVRHRWVTMGRPAPDRD